MKNKTLKFKTNIICNGCLSEVTPLFNKSKKICHWNVDLNSSDKILTVNSNGITQEEVIQIVKKSGFNAIKIK